MADKTLGQTGDSAICGSNEVDDIMERFLRQGDTEPDSKYIDPDNVGGTEKEEHKFSASAQAVINRLTRSTDDSKDSFTKLSEHGGPAKIKEPASQSPSAKRQSVDGDIVRPLDNETGETLESVKKESPKPEDPNNVSKAHLDFVNFQFDRLVSERKNVSHIAPNDVLNKLNNRLDPRPKTVQEILQEYKSDSSSLGERASSPNGRSGRMNISQNNETLDSPGIHLWRVGSSVDADVGDYKRSLQVKSGLSRSRTSMASLTSVQLPSDEKSDHGPDDSNVDLRPNSYKFTRSDSLKESSTDLQGLGYSFQRERDRLRHIEDLIRKTPITSTHSSTGSSSQMWRPHYNYQSKYVFDSSRELPSRHAMSSTEHKFSSDWRHASPDRKDEYLSRTMSSPSHLRVDSYSTHHHNSPITPEHNTGTHAVHVPKSHFKTTIGSMSSSGRSMGQKYSTLRDPLMHHSKNRPFDGKRNRNMSKAIPDNNEQTPNKIKASVKPQKSKSFGQVRPMERGKTSKENDTSRTVSKKVPGKIKSCRSVHHMEPSAGEMPRQQQDHCPRHGTFKNTPYQQKPTSSRSKRMIQCDPLRTSLVRYQPTSTLIDSKSQSREGRNNNLNHAMLLSDDIPSVAEREDQLLPSVKQTHTKGKCRSGNRESVRRCKSLCRGLQPPTQAWCDDTVEEDVSLSSIVDKTKSGSNPKATKRKLKVKPKSRTSKQH